MRFLPILCAVAWSGIIYGQVTVPPDGIKNMVSYTVEEKSFYTRPESTPVSALSKLDVQKMRTTRSVKSVTRQVTNTGDHSSTVIFFNPEEAFSPWPQSIGRIETDQTGTIAYSPTGTVIRSTPADSAYSTAYNALKSVFAEQDIEVLSAFPMPTSDMLTQLQNNGATVQSYSNGDVSIRNGAEQLLYQPRNLTVIRTKFEGQREVARSLTKYRSNNGILTPSFEWEEIQEIRPSGACMKSVITRSYSNYQIATRTTDRSGTQASQFKGQTSIQPNPATNKITMTLGNDVIPNSKVEIMDVSGSIVQTYQNCQPSETKDFIIQGLPSGIYFVRSYTRNGAQTIKFVKTK
jgi:hypothetical protein